MVPLGRLQARSPTYAQRMSLTEEGLPTEELASFLHARVSGSFASFGTTGFFKDVDHVAGFEAHRVRMKSDWDGDIRVRSRETLKELSARNTARDPHQPSWKISGLDIAWKTNQLQLVSLLLHDQPRVYVADNLPNMEELSGTDVETRDLDDFETEALKQLEAGEKTVTRATTNRILMLGALRASHDCLSCHATHKVGDLLGAFSYEFLRHPKVKPPEPPKPL